MTTRTVAALFAAKNGPYVGAPGIWAWTEEQDARNYAGPFPVIAHPPCERWGRYWGGGPSVKVKRKLGDDGGCFRAALSAVNRFGGVLEHPEATHAWAAFNIKRPNPKGGWDWAFGKYWVCQVEQGHYGHPARKKTWLYYVGEKEPPELIWGPSEGKRLDEGFHSSEERREARARGQKPIPRLSKNENVFTPIEFKKLLVRIARGARG